MLIQLLYIRNLRPKKALLFHNIFPFDLHHPQNLTKARELTHRKCTKINLLDIDRL